MAGHEPLVIFGASGFVGSFVRRWAQNEADDVVLVSRRSLSVSGAERQVQAGFGDMDRLVSQLPKGAIVLNMAYEADAPADTNVAHAEALADTCVRLGARRVVHVSTAMVAGVVGERWVAESTPCRPVTPYQRTKLTIEERLRERLRNVCPLIVLRPTAVFGAGGRNLKKLVADLTTQPWYVNYARACLFGSRPMNLVPVETVAAAIRFAATRPQPASHEVYFVADDESASNNFRYVETLMRRELRLPTYPVPPARLPASLLAVALRAAGKLSFDPRTRFSSARLIEAGFQRPVTFETALAAYAAASREASRAGAAA